MEWISVKDRLPENDEYKEYWLCIFPYKIFFVGRYSENSFYVEEWGYIDNVTHWQPIEPPKV